MNYIKAESGKKIKIAITCEFVLFQKGFELLIKNEECLTIVAKANNLNEIFDCLAKVKPDIIIINLNLPPESIISLCRLLFEKYPKIPILLFLDSSIEISIPEAIISGVRGILWKENSEDELIDAIKKVASGGLFFENPDNCRFNCHLSEKLKRTHQLKETGGNLSDREIEVLTQFAKGLSFKDIGDLLNISPRTVETHKENIFKKLNLGNTAEMIRYAIENHYC